MNPKYVDVVNWIKDQIEAKKLLPGQKLYSENELCQKFGMSRQTVRHALDILEEEDIVTRVRGSGTYINGTRQSVQDNRKVIAFITTYVDGYIFPKIMQGIEKKLFDNGFSIQIAFTNNRFDRECEVLKEFLNRNEIAGVIAETTKSNLPNPNLWLYQEMIKKGIPVLFINSYFPGVAIPHVSINDKSAGKKATSYLIEKGHIKIGGIFKLDDGQGRDRYAGYLEAMQEAKLLCEDGHVLWLDTIDVKHPESCRQRILDRFADCTAICCYNDEIAFSLVEIFSQEGIRVPEDISIVSIDNSELAILGDVALTSVNHPKNILGEKAAENILAMIRSASFDGNYEFDENIVERDSVKSIGNI